VVPSPENTALILRQRGSSLKTAPRQSRPPQAIAPMGGTLRRCQSAQAWHLQAGERRRRGTHKCLEHPTTTSLLILERISKYFFRYSHTQHPSWLYNCKFLHWIKIKGRLGFPPKTKSPSGATTGGVFPQKNAPIFSQKIAPQIR
jgi:hypothetical protein